MTAWPEDDEDAAPGAALAALDRLAIRRLVFDIRAWWARNRHLPDRVVPELSGRLDQSVAPPGTRGASDVALG
jgi:hypothetical protein